MDGVYPEGDTSTARTIRLIKAQALRDVADELSGIRTRPSTHPQYNSGLRLAINHMRTKANILEK